MKVFRFEFEECGGQQQGILRQIRGRSKRLYQIFPAIIPKRLDDIFYQPQIKNPAYHLMAIPLKINLLRVAVPEKITGELGFDARCDSGRFHICKYRRFSGVKTFRQDNVGFVGGFAGFFRRRFFRFGSSGFGILAQDAERFTEQLHAVAGGFVFEMFAQSAH